MKRTLTILLAVIAFSAVSYGQVVKWVYKGAKIDSAFWKDRSVHGLATTPDGNIWVQGYYNTDSVLDAGSGTYKQCRSIRVYTPAGVQTAFSPIVRAVTPSATDTFYYAGVGLRTGADGNVFAGYAYRMFKINGTDGTGMYKFVRPDSQSTIAPGVTAANEVFCGTVFPNYPVIVLDGSNLSVIGNAIDTSTSFMRSIDVSPDGNDIYYTGYGSTIFLRYHSDLGTLGTYTVADTLLAGMAIECSAWNPKDGYLYVSSGGQVRGDTLKWQNRTWYAFDPVTKTVKDSIVWSLPGLVFDNVRPRGIAFSPGGDTAYVGAFSVSGASGLVVFVREAVVSAERVTDNLPNGYSLEQNYPNPFNPNTEIRFAVPEAGMTRVAVYDLLGREIQVLVNEYLTPGDYRTTFVADHLSSGTYLYVMTSGTSRIVKKMVLMK